MNSGPSVHLIRKLGRRLGYTLATYYGRDRTFLVSLMRGLALVGAGVLLSFSGYSRAGAQEINPAPLSGRTSGAVLRSMARKIVRPVYPVDALRKRKTGVAVADVHLSISGTVTHVEVLEAPDPSIGKAVSDALSQWRFEKTDGSSGERAIEFNGELVFYFEIRDKKGIVLFPSEAGYVGSWKR